VPVTVTASLVVSVMVTVLPALRSPEPGVSATAVTAGIVVSTKKFSAALGWLTFPAASVAVTV